MVALDLTGSTSNTSLSVGVDGAAAVPLVAGDTVLVPDLAPGSHLVTLVGLGSSCTLSGENPLLVQTVAGDTTRVGFYVTCGDATPTLDAAGMDVLGSGYDIGGNYADVADVRAPILDLAALDRDGLLRRVQYERASYDVVSGQTSRDYLSNLQVSVNVSGGGFGFSGSLKTAFSQSRYESSQYSFATVQSIIRKYGLRVALSETPEQLRNYLTPAAAAAINDPNVDPLDLFDTFGMYVMRGIIVGGRLDYMTSANMSFDKSGRGIDVYASASFKSLFGSASIQTQVIDATSQSEFSATQNTHLEVYGGRSEYGQYIVNQGQYESWIESVNDNPVFMDFESNGLIGIWELATDANRQAQLKTAFETYAEAHGISLLPAGPIISNFADGDEGWTYDDYYGNEQTPQFAAEGGYFGGYIVGNPGFHSGDTGDTDVDWWHGWRFVAPSKFSGDKTAYVGGTLSFYLWYPTDPAPNAVGPAFWSSLEEYADIVSENGNLKYRVANSDYAPPPDSPFKPGNYFRSAPKLFIINLKAGVQAGNDSIVPGQWYRWDGTPADSADIWNSLASIDAIRIWGNYLESYPDTLALDKVVLRTQ
ncbi:MAG: MAC/perforin domain-containing protein [Gemmatimonadota bacterium]